MVVSKTEAPCENEDPLHKLEVYHLEAFYFPYMFETMLPIISDKWKSLANFCPHKDTLKVRSSRSPHVNLSQNKPVQNGV